MDDDADLVELTSVIRRTLRPRTRDLHLVEDITQETMLRVATAQPHLEPGALRAYAIVTARNTFSTHLRNEHTAQRHAHRVVDYTTLAGAEELTLEREETNALAQALDTLDEADRRLLLDHEVDELSVATLAARDNTTNGAMTMRLSRARAQLRLEFLLAFRRVRLPTDRCRPVLLAISAGDKQRQTSLGASDHLIRCQTCAQLSRPLLERRRGAAAWWFLPVPAWLTRAGRRWRTSRTAQMITVAAVVAAVIALFLGLHQSPSSSAAPPAPTTVTSRPSATSPTSIAATSTTTVAATTTISVAATHSAATPTVTDTAAPVPSPQTAPAPPAGCPPAEAITASAPADGCTYTFSDMTVTEVSANEGFWIRFTDGAPAWVHLVGHGESPQHVRPGDHVTIQATTSHTGTDAQAGIPADQTNRLDARPFYLDVTFANLQVRTP